MDHDERVRQAVADAYDAAVACGGVVCRGSAALAHGWELLELPRRPQITVPKNRRTARLRLSSVELRKLNLPEHHVDGLLTTAPRTLTDCLRHFPVTQGLCIADSAMRHGFPQDELDELARAIALGVAELDAVPQVSVFADGLFLGRPDLVDERLRIIIEADSAEHHATVDGINRDATRYDTFVIHGWLVLRFTWAQVVHRPAGSGR
jgi:hypothetical protein